MSEINFDFELDPILEQDLPEAEETETELPAAEPPEAEVTEAPEAEVIDQEPAMEEAAEEKPQRRTHTEASPKRAAAPWKKPRKEPVRREKPAIGSMQTERPQADAAAPAGKFLTQQSERPVRRPRLSKQEVFKQTTLPVIILGVAALLILIFIIGSITRAIQKNITEKDASIAASESIAAEQARLEAEMTSILENAEQMAAGYDFDGAVALIDTFSGNIGGYPQLQDARARYEYSKEALVPWEDPNTILSLSVQMLIADTDRAYNHEEYGRALKENFITVTEFQRILERLYENDYVLVSLDDFIESGTSESGVSYFQYKELLLPEGKKPLVLTQTNVNYNLYLVDSDEDLIADKDGVGIANKLVLNSDGSIACEIVNADGTTSTGAYDMIPILDAFIEEHPDFSYHGAKAVLALTGYNGLFGYRINADARAVLGEEQYEKDVASVQAIADALRNSGYDLACYTYGNSAYGRYSVSQIQADMNKWLDEIAPVIGQLDIMAFAQNSDINSGVLYSGEKFEYLKSLGFKYFLGFCTEGDPFTFIAEDYVRQGRLMLTGSNIANNSKWFNGIFDTEGVLDENRG